MVRYHKPKHWLAGLALILAAIWLAYRVTQDPHHGSWMGLWVLGGGLAGVMLLAMWQVSRRSVFSARHIALVAVLGSTVLPTLFAVKVGVNPLLIIAAAMSFGGGAFILPIAVWGVVLLWPFTGAADGLHSASRPAQ